MNKLSKGATYVSTVETIEKITLFSGSFQAALNPSLIEAPHNVVAKLLNGRYSSYIQSYMYE